MLNTGARQLVVMIKSSFQIFTTNLDQLVLLIKQRGVLHATLDVAVVDLDVKSFAR
jgi:hypothetical protein